MTNKKFSVPLAISGTEQELNALVPKLEELGYEWYGVENDYGKTYLCGVASYLVTGIQEDNKLMSFGWPDIDDDIKKNSLCLQSRSSLSSSSVCRGR